MGRWMRRATGAAPGVLLAASLSTTHAAEVVASFSPSQPGFVTRSGYGYTDLPGGTLLAMNDAAHGTELWFTDGTPTGTRLVRDIYPGHVGSIGGLRPD